MGVVLGTKTILGRGLAGLGAGALLVGGLAACGSDDDTSGEGGEAAAEIVVTTNLLGDVVRALAGDDAQVEVVMPPAANPHDFAASPRQVAAMRDADVLVVNGRGFEESLLDAIEAAESDGATVVTATDGLPADLDDDHGDDDHADDDHVAEDDHADDDHADDDHAEDDHADDDHADDDHAEDDHADDDHGHEHDHDTDAHFFVDPVLMSAVVEHLADELRTHVPALATDAFDDRVDAYLGALDELHHEVEELLAPVPEERRVLVTNHDVLGFFADRYDFEVLGVVVPGGSTLAEPGAADLQALAHAIEDAGVPAIFADTSSPSRLADALAAEGTGVEVVELHTESLGESGSGAETYLDMIRTNAQRIAAALAG